MAQKPVANALILELEPVVGENFDRHLGTEELWFAHDFVPFEQGENFAFLGGRDWDPSQVTLPKIVTDACEILLIDKDNVAHQREIQIENELEDQFVLKKGIVSVEDKIVLEGVRQVEEKKKVEYEFRTPEEALKNQKFHAE